MACFPSPGYGWAAQVRQRSRFWPLCQLTVWGFRTSGLLNDIHGSPIGDRFANDTFKGVAIDPDNSPTFESQAAYLKRHGLFLVGEERRLKKADWEVESF
jgi:hypothetical protein